MATRSKIRPVSLTADQIAAAAKAERSRKRTSRKALHAADAQAKAELSALIVAAKATPEADKSDEQILREVDEVGAARRAAEYAANALAAAQVDATATGASLESVLADMGLNPDGTPLANPDAEQTGYNGPMIALKHARVNYTKAANGILCNGDVLAVLCGRFTREATVAALVRALDLPANPYAHLNAGQQSMNLRNRARRALTDGLLTLAKIEECYAAE